MPEYLAPGVFVEEVSFRSKSIEGVATSTTGFAGMTAYGPVRYEMRGEDDSVQRGPRVAKPRLITSFTEFEQVFGGLTPLRFGGVEQTNYLGHAARAFFENGGKRLYVSRVFVSGDDSGVASAALTETDPPTLSWKARWPGAAGNVQVTVSLKRGVNLARQAFEGTSPWELVQVRVGDFVELVEDGGGNATYHVVGDDDQGTKQLSNEDGAAPVLDAAKKYSVRRVELTVTVQAPPLRNDTYTGLSVRSTDPRFIGRVLRLDDPADENAAVWLSGADAAPDSADVIGVALRLLKIFGAQDGVPVSLTGGNDGAPARPADLGGQEASPDDEALTATGLGLLGEQSDIAIVALPEAGAQEGEDSAASAAALIAHAERLRYRIAVVDAPRNSSISQVRAFRGRFDSRHAALYHPWVEVIDPTQRAVPGAPPPKLLLPPSGFITGIYARSDVNRGVHKAPANEVIAGISRFESNVTTARQEVLNPEGINALRAFEGRGLRVWGARTMSSDPEWKYVNVRRLFIYLEHSIDRSTQWAVFEPNNERLWANIRQSVEDFLYVAWKNGALMGSRPEEAYFVRCDRTTMSQNDIDNGRLVCLVGVAPANPAEFVIFRIGQWTAGSKTA